MIAATVRYAIEACDGNQSAAARMLGMERKAFVRRLSRLRPR
jgi:DNA-binding NtrC family response regulator